ncbi:MAG: DUF192 domain-containing protein [Olegusella sp.]|nr:DUF192 domain-containing protein [Olegusella sp.]
MWVRLRTDGACDGMPVQVLTGRLERLKGLLGTRPDACPVLLTCCNSVHTFGMHYALDLAFVDERGCVRKSLRQVGPKRLRSARHAVYVIERPCKAGEWLTCGQKVELEAQQRFEALQLRSIVKVKFQRKEGKPCVR